MIFDVVIVGAGPAGATLASELAVDGVSCLLFEKDRLPREKICAGGVSGRTARLLDFDISPVIERTVSTATFSYKFVHKYDRYCDSPIVYTTSRERFDRSLVEQAVKAGTKLIEGQKVTGVERTGGSFRINTGEARFDTPVLVGADGANSTIARELGLTPGFLNGLGIQAEVYCDTATLEQWSDKIGLDLGTIPAGYGWCFPKNDHLSIGAAGYSPFTKKLKPYLDALITSYCQNQGEIRRLSGAPVRIRRNRKIPIVSAGALLIGEASGLVNAFTGEGIYYAIKSAKLAAPEIMRYLKGETDNFESYQNSVNQEMMPELGLSYTFARLALTGGIGASRVFFDAFISNRRLWQLASSALAGETTYKEFRNKQKTLRPLLIMLSG